MALAGRVFRIFVSSTFSDLKAERNALQARVFPRLRELCARHGARFQVIDLRWGVSEESSLDQQTMSICLGEIERCQRTTPRPNFIVLLGDRYGWCPPPSRIPASEFGAMLGVLANDDEAALVKEWYSLDENAVPPEWRLLPRQKGSQFEDYGRWQLVEARLHQILAAAASAAGFPPEQRLPYIASATEQEIAAGALQVAEAPEHVLCFFRSIDGLPQQFSTRAFLAMVEERLAQEYPGGMSESSRELVEAIRELGPGASAKAVTACIQEALHRNPIAAPEQAAAGLGQQLLAEYTAKDLQNLDDTAWTVDEAARASQRDLKNRLRAHVPGNVRDYQAHWTGSGITTGHIDQLCEDVYNSLSRLVLDEIEHPHQLVPAEQVGVRIRPDDALDDEGRAHRAFAEERLRFFVGRGEMLSGIARYLQHNQRRALAIVGAGGTGKSALMARAIQQAQDSYPRAEIVYRFIGATPGSSDGRSLLDSLCHEIARHYRVSESDVPTDYRDLVTDLGKRMKLATPVKPLVLFLDSLDQLSPSQDARSLVWLPNELPENVSLVVSTREEDTLKALRAKQALEMTLAGLSRQEGDSLLSQWLASVGRTLQAAQRGHVLDRFEQSQGNPLYLRLAFEEARLWTSYSVRPPEELATGVKGIVQTNMIDRLMKEGGHGEALVSHALGYLAASRFGLAEDELLDLLSRDPQVYEWFFTSSLHLPADLVQWAMQFCRSHPAPGAVADDGGRRDEESAALTWLSEIRGQPERLAQFLTEVLPKADGPRLPVVLWSRLSFDLAPYLTERMVDGSSLLTFYHRELGDVSAAVFLARGEDQPYHARLADYFRFKADPAADRSWTGNYPHGLGELPYHLTRAARYEEVFQTLTDFKFLEHKAAEVGVLERRDDKGNPVKAYTGVLQLQDDFERALQAMPGEWGAGAGGRAPLIVTATDSGAGLSVYCPVCNKTSPLSKESLDTEIACPQEGCGTRLKVNPFVIQRS